MAPTPVASDVRKVLVLRGADHPPDELIDHLAEQAFVREVRTYDELLDAVRRERFDLIVTGPQDVASSESPVLGRQAADILDTIGQGVCLIEVGAGCIYANSVMHRFPPDLLAQVSERCQAVFGAKNDRGLTPLRFSLSAGEDQHFDITATLMSETAGPSRRVVALVWDVTAAQRLQRKINAIDLAGRELAQLDAEATAHLNINERVRLLEEKILRYMRDLLQFSNFAVLLIDKKTEKLEIVLQHGMSEQSRRQGLHVSPEGNGISGYVAYTGRSYICHDVRNDPRYIEGLESARSSLSVPLRLRDRIIGVFDIESEKPAAFNEDDRQYAEILAWYIAIAINTLDLLVTERFYTTDRLADDVAAEMAAPLNDILSEATALQESHVEDDDLRRRLSAICEHVTEVKRSIRQVTSPRGGLLGRQSKTSEQDPVLSGKRVLVADDEEDIRQTITEVLTGYGCEVESARDGATALRMIEHRAYDAILADIKMPNGNGYEIFAAAREHQPRTGVILMTGFGYDPQHSIVRARREGLTAVLFKPFKVNQLLDDLRRAVTPGIPNQTD
jgi:CheY-like chemotaxis protein